MSSRQEVVEECLLQAAEIARSAGAPAHIQACQGLPVCDKTFADDELLPDDCQWCQRFVVHPDGKIDKSEPARA